MRMIEQEIIQALKNKSDFQTSVTEDMHRKKEGRRDVLRWSDLGNFSYELWGHAIAGGDPEVKVLAINDCGYPTATTKSRINAVFAAFDIPMACVIRNKKMTYYLYGKETDTSQDIEAGEWLIRIHTGGK